MGVDESVCVCGGGEGGGRGEAFISVIAHCARVLV